MYRPFKSDIKFKEDEQNKEYVSHVVLDKVFSVQELDKICELWDDEIAKEGKVGGTNTTNYDHRKAQEIFLKQEQTAWIYDKIATNMLMINAIRYKFDIRGFLEMIRLIRYTEGDFFNWHMDYNAGWSSNRKLVMSLQLSDADDYEGGDLQLMTSSIQVPRTRGTAVIFPSFVLHRVTPITSGKRLCIIGLIGGPPFR
jgi:PKHD-type hydroxylase